MFLYLVYINCFLITYIFITPFTQCVLSSTRLLLAKCFNIFFIKVVNSWQSHILILWSKQIKFCAPYAFNCIFWFSYLLMKTNFCYKNLDISWPKKKKSWKCWKYNHKDVIRWILNVSRVRKNYVYAFKSVTRASAKTAASIDKPSVTHRNLIHFTDLWRSATL